MLSGSRRPLARAQRQLEMIQQTTISKTKPVPKKVSPSHKFISPMTKTHGTNSRIVGSSVWQGSRTRNLNTLKRNKYVAQPQHAANQGMASDSNELHDLRRQIAMREKELKLKSAQQLDPHEPERKRIKYDEEFPTSKSVVVNAKSMPSTVKLQQKDDKHVPTLKGSLPSGGKESADMIASCSGSEKSSRPLDPLVQNPPFTGSQSEKSSRLLDPLVQNQVAPSTDVTRRTLLRRSSAMESRRPSEVIGNPPSSSFPSKPAFERSCIRSSDNHEIIFGGEALIPAADSSLQASLNSATMWKYSDELNISARGKTDAQSLEEIEERQDKELEEAQEHRRRCEIEERNALKAYRKAQRVLIEANNRCTYLYHQRELYSARFRSLIVEDSSLFSSKQQNRACIGLNSSNNVSKVGADLASMLNHKTRGDFNNYNQPAHDAAVQFVEGTLHASDKNMDGQNLGSEACSEPDVSTSELLPKKIGSIMNGVCSPSVDQSISEDEDEGTFSCRLKSVQVNLDCERSKNCKETEEDAIDKSKAGLSDRTEDTILLEESLRSKLFARLGKRSAENTVPPQVLELTVERNDQHGDRGEKSRVCMDPEATSEEENNQYSDHEEESRLCFRDSHQFLTSISVSPIVLSPFSHMNVTSTISFTELCNGDKQEGSSGIYCREVAGDASCDKLMPRSSISRVNSLQHSVREKSTGGDDLYNYGSAIDPFWPLCMYELRGKCNNEECPWQHVKKFSTNGHQHGDSSTADCHAGALSHQGKHSCVTKFSKCINSHVVVSPPTYSVLAQCIGHCWQKCQSTSWASLFARDSALHDPFLLGSDSRIEVHGSWNRLSMYFQSRNGKMGQQLKQGLVDSEQILEMVFVDLNENANRSQGTTKALETLSRALEADPTSKILWFFYLLIFYSDKKTIGEDDMFFYAIKHNEGCYELWLFYINSRLNLNDRLVAYDSALSALCCHVTASVSDIEYASACILDLFLQMVHCFCMSGNVEKAICRICGLFRNSTDSDSVHSMLLSDILKCLAVPDKCIFWVCCIYLVIYRKLPNEILQQFEFNKELSAIEWPSVNLPTDDKQQAIKLMEVAVDSVVSCSDGESHGSKSAHASVHMFAVNHIRCIAAFGDLECCERLLKRYTQLYPSCLELCLMSARARTHDSGDLRFAGFEEALNNWPNEIPGVQCIWNQYAEYLLQNGRLELVKELMGRWFRCAWKVQCTKDTISKYMACDDGDNSHGGSLESVSTLMPTLTLTPDSSISNSNRADIMFGFLNFCLYRLLQNDPQEAQLAIDRALKVAGPKEFANCVREHATFLLTDESKLKEEGVSSNRILNVLKGYLLDNRAPQESVLLSRKFVQNIKKPRVHQLMNRLLSPLSPDFSLVNLVLQVWYGPTLLEQQFSSLKSLVDFVEAIMEITPSNYQLAISVCKLLSRSPESGNAIPANILFWAASLLVNAILQAVPVAPEYAWAEAASIFSGLIDIPALTESFHKRALTVYPFSIELWKSYLSLSKITGNVGAVVGAARERGIILE